MNKEMILAILVAYKAFNDKSLTVVVNEGEGEYVANDVTIDSIDGDNISVSNIDYEDIYDISDYEYPYNHININIERI